MPKTYRSLCIGDMAPGDDVEGFFLLEAASVRTSSNGSQYLTGWLSDRSGQIGMKIWDYNAALHEHIGSVIRLRGSVSEYNGALQLVVDRIRLAQPGDSYELSELVRSAPIDIPSVLDDTRRLLESAEDEIYRRIGLSALERLGDSLGTLPAAKTMHHAFLGGLLMHTHNIMRLAVSVSEIYGDMIDRDLLLVGAFCHDMGKRKEFIVSEFGLVNGYSVRGDLLGHLVMGSQEIAEIAASLGIEPDDEHVMLLQHLLLSHHGEPEKGAAVRPRLLEAEILSRLDMLDARIEACLEELNETRPGGMTQTVRALGYSIYCHR